MLRTHDARRQHGAGARGLRGHLLRAEEQATGPRRGIADEAKRQLQQEADYIAEGRFLERYAALVAGDPDLLVPRVHWDYTTPRVMAFHPEWTIRRIGDIARELGFGSQYDELLGVAA